MSLSVSVADKKINLSWSNTDKSSKDEYGGWDIVESQPEEKKNKNKGFLSLFLMGAGVSTLIFVSAIAYRSLGRKGSVESYSGDVNVVDTERTAVLSEDKLEGNGSESVEKPPKRVIITQADSTQVEALQLLKNLEIIDDDVKADSLCTRREYARWLVKSNLAFERHPKHRISILSSASVVQAFDDVDTEDPDFHFIQALAEVGIVSSKLSDKNNSSDLDILEIKERINFYPESYISRMDLINWKAQLEYSRVPQVQQMSTKDVGFMDVSTIIPEVSLEFFMDLMAGDKGILRRVFGKSRRFQPRKPATKAQAAVALTSGRMTEAIRAELLRWEAENSSILAEMDEIRSEFLLRGEIQKFWVEKLNEVKACGEEVARRFDAAVKDVEQEKFVRDKSINENLKESAALDCQRKLLVNLKEEVDEMSERLVCERVNFAAEQRYLQDMSIEVQAEQDAASETKSILEAEKEALRMLRSWIEDEARKSQARAQVYEQVGRRWKWKEDV